MQNKVNNKNIIIADIPFSRHVLLEITKKCNLNCRHCFTSAGLAMKNELSLQEACSMGLDLINYGFNAFTISGGEPLLKPNYVRSILKALRSVGGKKVKLYLFTNGFLLNKKNLFELEPFLDGVCLSLDGTKREHDWLRKKSGSYAMTLRAISILNEYNLPVFIQSMVTTRNIIDLEKVIRVAENWGVKAVRFSHIDFYGRATLCKNIGLSTEQLAELACQITKLKRKYNIYITDNMVDKDDLLANPEKYKKPALHILPNGIVLPWYGLPEKFALWKYPKENLTTLSNDILQKRVHYFHELINKSQESVRWSCKQKLDYDNIIAGFL